MIRSMLLRTDGRISVVTSLRNAFRSSVLISSCWARAKASSCLVMPAPRCAELRIPSSIRLSRSSSPRLRIARSVAPRIAVSKLLKSCARPPVSWPSASIFCARNNCSRNSSSLRWVSRFSLMSRVILAKPSQLALVVVDRVDDHAGPEARAVLALPPAFRLIAARLAGCLQRLAWNAGREILRRVEAAEMLADNLVGRIALDALRRRSSSLSPVLRDRACRWRSQ